MAGHSEQGAIPVEDATIDGPPTVDETLRRGIEHGEQAGTSTSGAATTEEEGAIHAAGGEVIDREADGGPDIEGPNRSCVYSRCRSLGYWTEPSVLLEAGDICTAVLDGVGAAMTEAEAETAHRLAREGHAKLQQLAAEPGFVAAVEMLKGGLGRHVDEKRPMPSRNCASSVTYRSSTY